MKRLLKGINPWLPVLVFTTAFHITRGSWGDAIIFGTGSVLLILDWKKLIRFSMPERPKMSWPTNIFVILVACSVLYFSERGGWQDIVLLLVLAPVSLTLIYYRDHGPKPSPEPVMVRTRWVYMILALAMAVVELFSYILATVYKDDKNFPTVSVIVNPMLESAAGRAIFLGLWMLIGVGLLMNSVPRSARDSDA